MLLKTFVIANAIMLALAFSAKALENELVVEYKSFYSHARKIDNEEMNALQFAFGFIDIRSENLCEIKQARISTEKVQIPLIISDEYRFTVPVERALRLADAKVILLLEQATNVCDMSVQLETKPEFLKSQYTKQELEMLFTQYEVFFDDMGGFLSFLMPSVEGLNIYFKDKTINQDMQNGLMIVNGVLNVDQNQFAALSGLTLPSLPLRITAHTAE